MVWLAGWLDCRLNGRIAVEIVGGGAGKSWIWLSAVAVAVVGVG